MFAAALYLLSATVALSPLGTWLHLGVQHQKYPSTTITLGYSAGSTAWPIIGVIAGVIVGITLALVLGSQSARIVAATGFGFLSIYLGVSMVQYLAFPQAEVSWKVGWGLWLCFGASVAGTLVGLAWIGRRISR